MTSLSTLFGGGGGEGQDPLEEGLPVIAVYGGDFNQYWELRLHRVHSGELMGSPWGGLANSTASYSHGQTNMHMFGYNSDFGSLSGQFSSEGYTSYSNFTQSLYQNDHYPYAMYGSVSKDGRMGMQSFHNSGWYTKLYYRIHVQALKGRRPRRQFNVYNYVFTETTFNSNYGWKSSVDLATYLDTSGQVSNNGGSAVYKQDTKQLVLYYATSTGAAGGYIHIIQGTVDLMSVTKVSEFFDTATFKRFSVSNATAASYSSVSYSVSLVLGDNNYVAVTTRNSNNHYYKVFDCSGSAGSEASQIVSDSIGNTTSYGPDQGLVYRGRYQQTWDAKWGCTYGPYYYYGCGLSAFFMSIENPAKYYKANITESGGGGVLTPSGRNGFAWLGGQNTDSQGINSWGVNFSSVSDASSTAVNEYIGTGNVTSSTLNPTLYSTGASLNSSASPSYIFQYPGYYYSTSYPRFMTVNWWDQQGGANE